MAEDWRKRINKSGVGKVEATYTVSLIDILPWASRIMRCNAGNLHDAGIWSSGVVLCYESHALNLWILLYRSYFNSLSLALFST